MSTAALETSEASERGSIAQIARHPDFIVLVLALPVFIATGWSLAGYAVGATVWIIQAVTIGILQVKVDASDNPRTVVGLLAGGSIARAWFTAIAVLVTGLIDERAGLAAVVLVLVLFTAYFVAKVFGRFLDQAGAVT